MTDALTAFAEGRNLRVVLDGCRIPIILGQKTGTDRSNRPEYRNHVFDYGDGRLGVCLFFPTKTRWTRAKKKLTEAGFVIRQDGDEEGTASFDPADARQSRLAVKMAGIRPKRRMTPARFAALEKARAARATSLFGQTPC